VALFMLIFFWTPPHFWALSLFVRMDYANAGIPMLPVVAGEVATRRQIFFYTSIMAVAAMAPVLLGLTGLIYGLTAFAGTALFAAMAFSVARRRESDPTLMAPERRLFKYSILYLFILFAAIVVDRWVMGAIA
jgi:protoheme IX farnesyltransferase